MVAYGGETDTLSYKTFTINTNKQLNILTFLEDSYRKMVSPHTASMLLLPGEVN